MTENPITLRRAEEADLSLIRQWVRDSGINPTGLDWERFIMAEADGSQPVGCVQLKPHRDGSVELASLVVAEEWRGRGIARLLIEYTVNQHDGTLYLMCRSGLGPLYEKFGFQPLVEAEMPRYFRQISRLVGIVNHFREPEEYLLVMRRN